MQIVEIIMLFTRLLYVESKFQYDIDFIHEILKFIVSNIYFSVLIALILSIKDNINKILNDNNYVVKGMM